MRVAHVTATFPPYSGGQGNVCFYNARELSRRGHEVHVFTSSVPGAPPRERREGVMVHRQRPWLQLGNGRLLPGLLWELRRFDIIHLHLPYFGGEAAGLAAKISATPLVVTYHMDTCWQGLLGVAELAERHTLGRLILRSAARVLFTSRDYGRASRVRHLLRDREHVIDELPNGVDIRTFHPDNGSGPIRQRHHLAEADKVVLLVAALDRPHRFKGVDIFLRALVGLPREVKGVVVGTGDLEPVYRQAARDLGIAGRITFGGAVSSSDLPSYYRLANVTVLPSVTMMEAFGLVLVESLASGTPVIATNLPGVRTVVDHGRDGLLVEPNDPLGLRQAIVQILGDAAQSREMGRRGRAKVEARYSWERIGERLEVVYYAALSETNRAQALSSNTERRVTWETVMADVRDTI